MAPKTTFYGVTQDTGRYQSEHSGALPPLPDSAMLVNDDVLTPLRHQFRVLLQRFATANIVVYPVDARGLMALNAEDSRRTDQQIASTARQRTRSGFAIEHVNYCEDDGREDLL